MKNTSKYILLSTILLQAIIILTLNISILTTTSLDVLQKNVPLFNIVIITITILVIISFKKVGEYEEKQAELKLVKNNMKEVEELVTILRTERHDYISHIQSIKAMLYLEEYEDVSEYIKGISKEYRMTNEIIRVGHPALTAILNSKREVAQEKGINFMINCKQKIESIQLNSWELSSLFSNLIENAIEAIINEPKNRWVKLTIDCYEEDYIIEVENPGEIDNEILTTLYDQGVSTKDSVTRGYGLYICKKILDKYNGSIAFKNTSDHTVIFTVILRKGRTTNDIKNIT